MEDSRADRYSSPAILPSHIGFFAIPTHKLDPGYLTSAIRQISRGRPMVNVSCLDPEPKSTASSAVIPVETADPARISLPNSVAAVQLLELVTYPAASPSCEPLGSDHVLGADPRV